MRKNNLFILYLLFLFFKRDTGFCEFIFQCVLIYNFKETFAEVIMDFHTKPNYLVRFFFINYVSHKI